MKEATARIKINKLLKAAGWRFGNGLEGKGEEKRAGMVGQSQREDYAFYEESI